jgi:uncharacterized protein involved in exopolysaccharide biosynthesis
MNENIRLLKPLFRGLPIIVLVVILSVLSAKKYLNYVTPMYESTAKLRLADVHEGVPGANLFKDLDVFASANKIATEIEVLKSDNLIGATLSQLPFGKEIYRKGEMRSSELFRDSPLLIEGTFETEKAYDKIYGLKVISKTQFILMQPDAKTGITGTFGKPISIDGAKFFITLNEDFIRTKKNAKIIDNYEFEFLSNEKLLSKINKNLDIVSVDKDVPVIRINLKNAVPEKAALFVNKLAEMYIKDYIEGKYRAANTTVDFLKNEIGTANQKLTNSEENIQNYRVKRNIINVTQETETDLRKISQLKIQQTNMKMNLDAIKDLNKYIASGKDKYLDLAPNFEAFTDLLSTEMVKNMKKLQSDKKDLLLTYTPEHEKVKIIDRKIKDLVDYQIESIKNTEKNLQVKYDDLSNDIAESEKVFIGLPEKEKMLNILNREFNMYEKNYNFLNEKRIEAEIAKSAKIAFHKIISVGEIPKTPVSPIRGIIIVVAAFLGMLGSILLIYIVHFAKAKVNDAYTIEKNSTIPIAFLTPYITKNESVLDNFLKEAIQMELKEMIQSQSIITISSYDKSKDHLFHSTNLIKALIAQGRKVLVVDATGQMEDKFSKNDFINYSENKYLSYTKTVFQEEIKSKLQDYDLCIIHNQSLKEDKLGLLFMSLATQNLMVLDSRKTAEKSIIKIELLKDEYQLPNVWFVLNKAGYNPSIFIEIRKIWVKYVRKQKVA